MKYLISILICALLTSAVSAADLNVFAAASLKGALDEIGAAYKIKSGIGVVATYAASGTLAKQIEAGAPADILISADEDWMEVLAGEKLIRMETRVDVVGNTLVLIKNKSDQASVKLGEIAASLGRDKLALAEVTSVPAGKYAKTALEKLGAWQAVQYNVVMQDNVRGALSLVARGEAKLGVVYGSDVKAEPKVEIAALFPEDSHVPIRYPAAVVAQSQNAATADFLKFLCGQDARMIFTNNGFKLLK